MPERRVTQSEAKLFFRAACCLIAADGKVRGQEMSVLSEAMNRLGFPQTVDQLRGQIVLTCKDIHAKGVDGESASLEANLRSLAHLPLAGYLRQAIQALAESDGVVAERERQIAVQFQRALSDASASTPPPLASPKKNATLPAEVRAPAQRIQSAGLLEIARRLNWNWAIVILAVALGLARLRQAFTSPSRVNKSEITETRVARTTPPQSVSAESVKPNSASRATERTATDVRKAFFGAWAVAETESIMFFYPDGRAASKNKQGDIRMDKRWSIKTYNQEKRTVTLSTNDGGSGERVEWRLTFSPDFLTAEYENAAFKNGSLLKNSFKRQLSFLADYPMP